MPLLSTLETITTQIDASSSAISSGGYVVDSYHFEITADAGSTWTSLNGQDGSHSLLTQVTSTSLTGGNSYTLRVQAHNIHGWGPLSEELTIIASGIPEVPTPEVVIDIRNLDVWITWVASFNNYSPITAY